MRSNLLPRVDERPPGASVSQGRKREEQGVLGDLGTRRAAPVCHHPSPDQKLARNDMPHRTRNMTDILEAASRIGHPIGSQRRSRPAGDDHTRSKTLQRLAPGQLRVSLEDRPLVPWKEPSRPVRSGEEDFLFRSIKGEKNTARTYLLLLRETREWAIHSR